MEVVHPVHWQNIVSESDKMHLMVSGFFVSRLINTSVDLHGTLEPC